MNTVRQKIGSQLFQIFNELNPRHTTQDFLNKICWCIRVSSSFKERASLERSNQGIVFLPFSHLKKSFVPPPFIESSEFKNWCQSVQEQAQRCNSHRVLSHEKGLQIDINTSEFIKDVLTDVVTSEKFGVADSILFRYRPSESYLEDEQAHQNIIIEYSSPNIAKPFHVGHLRSTIIGNVLSNMYEYLGHKVTRMNYLGDWGTQFGYIGIGLEKYFDRESFEISPIRHYFDVYVKTTRDSNFDEKVHNQASDFFNKMEQGSEEELSVWNECRDASIKEYKKVYERLGVKFDVYCGESMYRDKALEVLKLLENKGFVKTESTTGLKYMELEKDVPSKNVQNVSLLKSNGSTLYLTRDIAAAIDRVKEYNCDKMHYVVETGQQNHFENMHIILRKLGVSFFEKQTLDDIHIKFGRIGGMKSRTGNVVLLSEVLDIAKDYMKEAMLESNTTKPEVLNDEKLFDSVCDTLAVSAIITKDLLANRVRDYTIKWHKLIKVQGHTGIYLQYTHARLCSLVRQVYKVDNADEGESIQTLFQRCDTNLLVENEALDVIQTLAVYDEALHYMHMELQPHYLVHYLLSLCRVTSSALKSLYVNKQPKDIADARLLMFQCARLVLCDGLKILGITPIEKM